jgi:hypothetical protein
MTQSGRQLCIKAPYWEGDTVGGLIIGLFTRFFAAALAIEMLVALLFVHLPKGYAAAGGGYEYVLLIGSAAAVLFRLTASLARSFRRTSGQCLRGDRIKNLFAALHESGIGP